jgi:hypothetical protein
MKVAIASTSGAMDGGFTGIADLGAALAKAAAGWRLIGGVAVMLHLQRLVLDVPLRATADADFGVSPALLKDASLVSALGSAGYRKVAGNRWERPIDGRRTAAVDLLVPAYRSRARHTVRIGDVTTTEVPGLAVALRRPGVELEVEFALTDGAVLHAEVVLPDAVSMVALKAGARGVRNEDRDAEDLWRCLEIAAAEGVTPDDFAGDEPLANVASRVARELDPAGPTVALLTTGLQPDAAARRRTRLRALVAEVTGTP